MEVLFMGATQKDCKKWELSKMGIKLKISSDGLLLPDQDGIALSGDTRNSWIGVSTLQALFIKEHDAICDTLKVGIVLYDPKKKM